PPTGGTAVDQQRLSFSGQVNTRLPAPATAEGITAAHKPNPHGTILAHPSLPHRPPERARPPDEDVSAYSGRSSNGVGVRPKIIRLHHRVRPAQSRARREVRPDAAPAAARWTPAAPGRSM